MGECLSKGHTQTAEAYIGMVADLGVDFGTDKFVQLLSTPSQSIIHAVRRGSGSASAEEAGFTAALRNGQAETAGAFIRGLRSLDKTVRVKVLRAEDQMGTPLLLRAVHGGDAAMIKTYADAIAQEAPDVRGELLRASTVNGPAEMHIAIKTANDAVLEAYEQAIMRLPPLYRDRLLDEEARGQSLRMHRQTRERAATPTRQLDTDRQPPRGVRRLRSRSRSDDTEDGRSRLDGGSKRQRLDEGDSDDRKNARGRGLYR